MSESEKNEPRILIANPNRFKPAQEKLSDYQKKIRRDQEKKQESRNARLSQGAPYQVPPSKIQTKSLSRDQELALSGINEMNNRKEIADVKNILDITPSKPVPEGVNPFLPTPMEVGLIRSEEKKYVTDVIDKEDDMPTYPVALDFDVEEEVGFDELNTNEELPPNIKRIGGIKRRKSRKLRKSSKKSRKSRRKTTRKVRRHRRRH
jgi:hypothetical protein